jgi:AraC-like DNA-binding protein
MNLTKRRGEAWLEAFNQYLIDHLSDTNLTMDSTAADFGISRRQLYRRVKLLTNQTPHNYLIQVRFQKAHEHLKKGTFRTVAETAKAFGYADAIYFARKFKERFGVLPSEV